MSTGAFAKKAVMLLFPVFLFESGPSTGGGAPRRSKPGRVVFPSVGEVVCNLFRVLFRHADKAERSRAIPAEARRPGFMTCLIAEFISVIKWYVAVVDFYILQPANHSPPTFYLSKPRWP